MMSITTVLKALGDETRIRIINLLHIEKLCVCEIEEILNINQSNTSRHLSKLKNANLIDSEKEAQWVYYYINKDILAQYSFIKSLLDDLVKNTQCKNDIVRFRLYREKNGGCTHMIRMRV